MVGDGVASDGEDDVHEIVLRFFQLANEDRPAVQVVRCRLHEVVQFLHLMIHRLVAVVENGQRMAVRQLRVTRVK